MLTHCGELSGSFQARSTRFQAGFRCTTGKGMVRHPRPTRPLRHGNSATNVSPGRRQISHLLRYTSRDK